MSDEWGENDCNTFCEKNGEIYQVCGYQPSPTLCFRKVSDGKMEYHTINCMHIKEFTKLIPDYMCPERKQP
jgi:hypothetical protein